jgi:hypothetical protein
VAIIGSATTSQTFRGKGATVTLPMTDSTGGRLSTSDAAQLEVRYDAASGKYEVQLPSSQSWQAIAPDPSNGSNLYRTSGTAPVFVSIESAGAGYQYSALASWSNADIGLFGGLAFGIPTPAGGVPTSGTATYSGEIAGHSTESYFDGLAGANFTASVEGDISLSFNFTAGTLSGSISPIVYLFDRVSLDTLAFTNTVYSAGNTNFSGKFDTSLSGINAFSGQFTGPQAQELIGSFAFPYKSPVDGHTYQAGGGFVAK